MIELAILFIGKILQTVGKALRAVPWWAYLAAGALFAAWVYGEARYDQGEADTRAEYETRMAKEADQAAQFMAEESEAARRREQALSDQLLQAQADHEKALRDADARAAGTVAGLRAGNLKLRQHWQACLSRPHSTPGDTGGTDDDADLRAADIGHLQGIGARCDAEVKFWQTAYKSAEQAVNAQGDGE